MPEFITEKVPLAGFASGRRPNPIAVHMRTLLVGESFVIPRDHPAWTGSQVRNENSRKSGAKFAVVQEGDKLRIGRIA